MEARRLAGARGRWWYRVVRVMYYEIVGGLRRK
jgi:hypothetical protein